MHGGEHVHGNGHQCMRDPHQPELVQHAVCLQQQEREEQRPEDSRIDDSASAQVVVRDDVGCAKELIHLKGLGRLRRPRREWRPRERRRRPGEWRRWRVRRWREQPRWQEGGYTRGTWWQQVGRRQLRRRWLERRHGGSARAASWLPRLTALASGPKYGASTGAPPPVGDARRAARLLHSAMRQRYLPVTYADSRAALGGSACRATRDARGRAAPRPQGVVLAIRDRRASGLE
eukprot:353394-Chlamydomonas_euryale.AAC.16